MVSEDELRIQNFWEKTGRQRGIPWAIAKPPEKVEKCFLLLIFGSVQTLDQPQLVLWPKGSP